MSAKKRSRIRAALPPMPLSELPMMKALVAMVGALAEGTTTLKPAIKGKPATRLTLPGLTTIDKLQILALRRPRALIIIAQMFDRLLDQQLAVLDSHQESEHVDRRGKRAPKMKPARPEQPILPILAPGMAKAVIPASTKRRPKAG